MASLKNVADRNHIPPTVSSARLLLKITTDFQGGWRLLLRCVTHAHTQKTTNVNRVTSCPHFSQADSCLQIWETRRRAFSGLPDRLGLVGLRPAVMSTRPFASVSSSRPLAGLLFG